MRLKVIGMLKAETIRKRRMRMIQELREDREYNVPNNDVL